ncbi:MAG: hypothetical protein MR321_06470 [Bacteroides sp.]|jgi:hypothetical protein|uniref:hypothetical protein n=1 Tax=Phocaeicola faecicola TaxID=2739389 RepID=UPI0015E79FA9|nr:hypothetical protein [Phocaeicola faecicola]MCI5743279.1 hypothetical protein [Bacteroides sp.]MCI7180360.1 hypothetical protein [Lachnospiraceae bacterium]
MKRTLLFLLLIPLLLWSCKGNDDYPLNGYIEATFELTGDWAKDYTEFEDFTDYIGIEILHADGTPYAYGLFNDIADPKIKLCPNEQYIIRAMLVPNGIEMLSEVYGGKEVRNMFQLNTVDDSNYRKGCDVGKDFIYDSKVHFWQMGHPTYSYPYKIYAAYIPLYTPSSEHTIKLDLQRMFGTVIFKYDRGILDGAENVSFNFKYRDPEDSIPSLPVSIPKHMFDLSFVCEHHMYYGNICGQIPEKNIEGTVGVKISTKTYYIQRYFQLGKGDTIGIFIQQY